MKKDVLYTLPQRPSGMLIEEHLMKTHYTLLISKEAVTVFRDLIHFYPKVFLWSTNIDTRLYAATVQSYAAIWSMCNILSTEGTGFIYIQYIMEIKSGGQKHNCLVKARYTACDLITFYTV